MSKRRFGNLLKRNLSSMMKVFSTKSSAVLGDEFVKSQLKDISRLGGNLILMRMGN